MKKNEKPLKTVAKKLQQRMEKGNEQTNDKDKSALGQLAYFDFMKCARKFARHYCKKMPKNMGNGLEIKESDPLAFSIAEEIINEFDIYAASELGHLFVHEPGNGHFTEMDQRRFSLFVMQAYHRSAIVSQLSERVKKAVFDWLLSAPSIQVSQDFFESQERFINVKNGVVDLVTGKLEKHDANRYGFLGMLPFSFKPKYAKGNKMPYRFSLMLTRTFPDKNDRKRFLQCLAYLISNCRSKKIAFFWIGKPHTGKSTFQRLIAQIVGKENISNIPLEKFSDRFSIANLFGKKINMAGETGVAQLKSMEVFKAVVGNDWVDAEFKGKDHFSFLAKVKNLFCGNSLPLLSRNVAEKAVYERMEMLLFQKPVDKKHQIPFFEKDLLEKEGDEILTVLIRELRNFYKDGCQFTESKSSHALKEKLWKENKNQDSVRAFLKDCCTIDPNLDVAIGSLCNAYKLYARHNGFEVLSDNVFINELLAKGDFRRKKLHPSRTLQYRGVVGLALVEQVA